MNIAQRYPTLDVTNPAAVRAALEDAKTSLRFALDMCAQVRRDRTSTRNDRIDAESYMTEQFHEVSQLSRALKDALQATERTTPTTPNEQAA